MIHYTDRVVGLMRDIVTRVPALAFIDLSRVVVFGRQGSSSKDGPLATCHSVNQPPSDPTHYWWRDRRGRLIRRSEWFVVRSPVVSIGGTRIDYLISVSLPRFCDQTLGHSSKRQLYESGSGREGVIAKLDTIVHELYHIDPELPGIRRLTRADGEGSRRFHCREFYRDVARMVRQYLASGPEAGVIDFLRYGSRDLVHEYGEVWATTFDSFPSFPQPYPDPLRQQPLPAGEEAELQIVRAPSPPRRREFTERHLETRRFLPRPRSGQPPHAAPRGRTPAAEARSRAAARQSDSRRRAPR